MQMSQNGRKNLTETFEGLELASYQDQGGVWTIGYGHTRNVYSGMLISDDQAEVLLESDMAGAEAAVNHAVKVGVNQNQFDALVDFVFNLGPTSLLTSTLLRDLNAGQFDAAAEQFQQWDHCRGVTVPGLLRRRLAERDLFLTPVGQNVATASSSS